MNYFTNSKKKRKAVKEAGEMAEQQRDEVISVFDKVTDARKVLIREAEAEYISKIEELDEGYVDRSRALWEEMEEQGRALDIELFDIQLELFKENKQVQAERKTAYTEAKKSLEANKAADEQKLATLVRFGIEPHIMKKLFQKLDSLYAEKFKLLEKENISLDIEINSRYSRARTELATQRCRFDMLRDDHLYELKKLFDEQMGRLNSSACEVVASIDADTETALKDLNNRYKQNIEAIGDSLDKHITDLREQARFRQINGAIFVASVAALGATGGLSSLATLKPVILCGSVGFANLVNGALLVTGVGSLVNLIENRQVASVSLQGNFSWGNNRATSSTSTNVGSTTPNYNNNAAYRYIPPAQLRASILGAPRDNYHSRFLLITDYGLQSARVNIPCQPTYTPLGSGYVVAPQHTWGLNTPTNLGPSRRNWLEPSYARLDTSFGITPFASRDIPNNRGVRFDERSLQFQIVIPAANRPQPSFVNLACRPRDNSQYATVISLQQPTRPSFGERVLNWFIPTANASEIPLDLLKSEEHQNKAELQEGVNSKRHVFNYERDFKRDYMVTLKNGGRIGLAADAYVKVHESHGYDDAGEYYLQAQAYGNAQVRLLEYSAYYPFGELYSSIDLFAGNFDLKIEGEFKDQDIFTDSNSYFSGKVFHISSVFEGSKRCALSLCIEPKAHIDGYLLDVSRDGYSVKLSRGDINCEVKPNFTRDPNAQHTTEQLMWNYVALFFSRVHKTMLDNFARTEEYDDLVRNPLITEERKEAVVYPMFDRCCL